MFSKPHVLSITTGATASAGTSEIAAGDAGARVLSVHVSSNTYATTTIATVTNRLTGQAFTFPISATTAFHYAPRQLTHTSTGGVSALVGDSDFYYTGGSAIDVALATAGLSKTGTVTIITG